MMDAKMTEQRLRLSVVIILAVGIHFCQLLLNERRVNDGKKRSGCVGLCVLFF